jgi:hypothetical protein
MARHAAAAGRRGLALAALALLAHTAAAQQPESKQQSGPGYGACVRCVDCPVRSPRRRNSRLPSLKPCAAPGALRAAAAPTLTAPTSRRPRPSSQPPPPSQPPQLPTQSPQPGYSNPYSPYQVPHPGSSPTYPGSHPYQPYGGAPYHDQCSDTCADTCAGDPAETFSAQTDWVYGAVCTNAGSDYARQANVAGVGGARALWGGAGVRAAGTAAGGCMRRSERALSG